MKLLRWVLVGIAVVGLGIDAWTHFDLASLYRFNRTSVVNEAVLFRVEASLAIVAAVWLVLQPKLLAILFSVALTGGGAFLLVLYRYVDVGKIGPIPNMYEPIWTGEKQLALAGELIALVASLVLLGMYVYDRRASGTRPRQAVVA
jgi:hypothetical protein